MQGPNPSYSMPDIMPASLRGAVDPAFYERGLRYAGQGAVVQLRWDHATSALQGLVRGSGGRFYTTIAYLTPRGGASWLFSHGGCSCPVGTDCKHVVALVLTASGRHHAAPLRSKHEPAWRERIDALLADAAGAVRTGQVPLAIELTLRPAAGQSAHPAAPGPPAPPRLSARLVQPRGSGWTGGSLSWSALDSLQYYGNHPADQMRLLREIYGLHRSGKWQPGFYGYAADTYLDLGEFESRQLWPMLDEARQAGLRLVQRGRLGDVPPCRSAEIRLDVSEQPDGALAIAAVVEGIPDEAVPIRFIGSSGHGLVYADRAETERLDCASWHIGLARLPKAVPASLLQMTLTAERLAVPAADRSRFRETYYPRLRKAATVSSRDGSFTPPRISGPTLMLLAHYQPGHRADVSWEWAYQVGESRLHLAPGSAGDGDSWRDHDAEQEIVAGLNHAAASLGLIRTGPGGPVLATTSLEGIDTMRLAAEVLPLLAGQPGVDVKVTGDPVDYREATDSLRISVSVGAIPGDTDWFDLGISISAGGQKVPFADVFVALSQGQSHLLLPDGTYFALDKPELQALADLIAEARALQDVPGAGLRISRFQASLWSELTELGVISHQAQAWRRQVTGLLAASPPGPRQPPAGLRARLRPYQQDGFCWLAYLWERKLGGLLADDMGLGKTLQSLALICHARNTERDDRPFLIVAPTSVVPNWAAEAARFAPGLRVVTIGETDARRGRSLAEVIAGADAVVTSYALLRLDVTSYATLGWSGLILDEAQFVKNYRSRLYQCARRVPAEFKLAITGTPMENNLMELWALLSITAPGLFPNPDRFKDYYARPIEKTADADLLDRLRSRIKPLVRRRTKEQVAGDLPAKQEQVLEVDLHPRHRRLYETQLQRERQKVLRLVGDLDANRFTILRSLTLLRQLSLHAGLVDPGHEMVPSAKIDVLLEQLGDVIGGGHRALVFSQFTGFLARVRQELDLRGIPHCYLDGKTRDRAAEVERFATRSVPVFLISLKAGGFGLNLTGADYCFLLDPWWNPATEAQAVDRAHRIGQTKNVMVYRLIARGTIEEKVMALKTRKAELFASVLDHGNVFGSGLDADDIRGLFA